MTKEQAAEKMVEALRAEAARQEVDLSTVTAKNFNSELDKLFGDGGQARCEHFADHGWEYSLQFGKFGSNRFQNAQAEAVEAALELLVKG